jgi:hypothetical protein
MAGCVVTEEAALGIVAAGFVACPIANSIARITAAAATFRIVTPLISPQEILTSELHLTRLKVRLCSSGKTAHVVSDSHPRKSLYTEGLRQSVG